MNNFCTMAIHAAAQAIWLPASILVAGVLIIEIVTGHRYVTNRLREQATRDNKRQLNLRLWGYTADEVGQHWEALDARALQIERSFLRADLVFPAVYGLALVIALLEQLVNLGIASPSVWIFVPVAATVIADWTENLVQLAQLRRFTADGKAGLEPAWIRVASLATTLKWLFLAGTLLLLIALPVCAL